MSVLVTGAAGFIGYHVCKALAARNVAVIGVDNLNNYYDPALKLDRLGKLMNCPVFTFSEGDISNGGLLQEIASKQDITTVVHLAAQVGVRSSLDNPREHVVDNLAGQFEVLELCRARGVQHLVHASTSAVYGANRDVPHKVSDNVDNPLSLYAATKRGGELLARTWSSLHGLPVTSLRFFTVYGPWGRPDMATWKFTAAIINGTPIDVHGGGKMQRSFTYIDDAVSGIIAVCDRPPPVDELGFHHAIYNIGNPRTESVNRFIEILEGAIGRVAIRNEVEAVPGEMWETMADIELSSRHFGFTPRTTIDEGLPRFVEWYHGYHGTTG